MTRKADRVAAVAAPFMASPPGEARKIRRFRIGIRCRMPKDAGQACDEPAKNAPIRRAPDRRGRLEAGLSRPGGRCGPLFSLRVKKSLPDRGGCSMINNLPKLMGESATRGRFQDVILSCFR